MLNKLYILIIVFLACGWGYSQYNKLMLENKNTSLETKNSALEKVVLDYKNQISFWEKEVESRNKKSMEACERMCEIEKRAEKEKKNKGFDWNSHLPNDSVVNQLRKD